jgi:hypothetical protein
MKKAIFYKNWLDQWTFWKGKATKKNLAQIKKTIASNGKATIQLISVKQFNKLSNENL